MKQLVSILIPAFNAEKWIAECIDSALAQTWPRKEIIVVDDGSRDSTLRIARSYSSKHVYITTQNNSGASTARNYALSLAQGDYIQWLDADDLLAPSKVAIQMNFAEPGESSLVLLSSSWGKFYGQVGNVRLKPHLLWENLDPLEWLYRKIDQNLWMAIESWLVSRKLTDLAGPWNESLSLDDDGEYFCRVLSNAIRVQFIDEALCYVRADKFGLSSNLNPNDKKLESQLYSLVSYVNTLRSFEDSERTRDACCKLLNRWSIYFYPERPDLFNIMQSISLDLGKSLDTPNVNKKYRWLKYLFGFRIAKRAQFILPALRSHAKNIGRRRIGH